MITSSILARIALLKHRKRINSSLKKSMASSFQRELRRRLASFARFTSTADSGHSGSYQFRAASQPVESFSIFRSKSRFTRTTLATSRPGTTTTIAAQNGGDGSHTLKDFLQNHENSKETRPGNICRAEKGASS